jgi:hypothetical protein
MHWKNSPARARRQAELRPFVDVQVALNVIGRRSNPRKLEEKTECRGDGVHRSAFLLDLKDCHLLGWISKGFTSSGPTSLAHVFNAHNFAARILRVQTSAGRILKRRYSSMQALKAHTLSARALTRQFFYARI